MKRAIVGAVLLGTGACHQPAPMTPLRSSEEITAEFRAKIEQVNAEAAGYLYWPICASAPERRADCGMLADKLLARDAVDAFVRGTCHEDGVPSKQCVDAFQESFLAAVRQRYRYAEQAQLESACLREDCSTLVGVEFAAMKVHNEVIFAARRAKVEELIAAHEREQTITSRAREARAHQQADNERAAAILRGIGDGMQRASASAPPARGEEMTEASPPSAARNLPSASHEERGCSSDFSCGMGNICVKAPGRMSGTCARAVDEYGTRTFSPPRSSSMGPGTEQCGGAAGLCPPGFRCVDGNCRK